MATVLINSVLTRPSVSYENGVLSAKTTYLKSPSKALDISLQIGMKQIFQMKYSTLVLVKGLQKNQRSKLEVEKNLLDQHQSRICLSRQFLINLQLWPRIFLQPLDLQECTVPHLKDLINICLENESQGHYMTFNMIYDHSKYPHFISYRSLC